MQKLYKKDSKGKIREWSISTGIDKGIPFYEVTHGQLDGALQTDRVLVKSGKNLGRVNATTAQEQCELEAVALFERQKDRKGYTEDIPDTQPLKPMLAKKYQDEMDKVEFPCAVQPKLDGGRTIALVTKDGCKLISRQMKQYKGLDHIEEELAPLHKKYGDFILDGELFNPDISFQTIMSLIRKTKNFTEESLNVQLWVYDMVDENEIFHQRYINWSNITNNLHYVRQVPTLIVKSELDIIKAHKKFTALNFEGTMIRNLNSYYKLNSRSSDLLKYKDFIDEEFKITGWKTGKGKYANVPTFIMETKEGYPFEGVPVGTQEQRAEYLANAKKYIGKLATVRFFEYTTTKKPVPRFPVIYDLGREDI